MDAGLAVRKALVEVLSTALAPVEVFDAVPRDTEPPYVSIGAHDRFAADGLTSAREAQVVMLSVWSTWKGQSEVQGLLGQIKAALHRQRVPLASGYGIAVEVGRLSATPEPDGVTYQGTAEVRWRVKT